MSDAIDRAARLLAGVRSLVVSTGAGMSRESGIPTFRDALEGLWARYDPQRLATEAGFRADPALVWGWYAERRRRIEACAPHAGHRALVELARLVPDTVVITQNVDGLHAAAGSPDVVELHGNIRRFRCLDRAHTLDGEPPPDGEGGAPPPCPRCGSPLRPDVVWFGEMLPAAAVERAWALAERCEAMLVVGTSGTVWPAAELPHIARRSGARVVEVNPEPSGVTHVTDVLVAGGAAGTLPALVRRIREARLAL